MPLENTNTTSTEVAVQSDTIIDGTETVNVNVVAVEGAQESVDISATSTDNLTEYTANVPNGVLLMEGASTLTLAVEPTDEGGISIDTGLMVAEFDITIPEVSKYNNKVITVTIPLTAGLDPTQISLTHDNVAMLRVGSLGEIFNNTFYYDTDSGDLTIGTTSFSTFLVEITDYYPVVTTAAQLTTALAGNAEAIILEDNILETEPVQINREVVIYAHSHTLKANISGSSNITLNDVNTAYITVSEWWIYRKVNI